jgi:hypothetical protein
MLSKPWAAESMARASFGGLWAACGVNSGLDTCIGNGDKGSVCKGLSFTR